VQMAVVLTPELDYRAKGLLTKLGFTVMLL
jgi:hypothetical protein